MNLLPTLINSYADDQWRKMVFYVAFVSVGNRQNARVSQDKYYSTVGISNDELFSCDRVHTIHTLLYMCTWNLMPHSLPKLSISVWWWMDFWYSTLHITTDIHESFSIASFTTSSCFKYKKDCTDIWYVSLSVYMVHAHNQYHRSLSNRTQMTFTSENHKGTTILIQPHKHT